MRPFPGAGPRTLISTNGGAQPVWSRNGRELLYIASSSAPVPSVTMMSVEIVTQPKLSASTPRSLFTAPSILPRTVPTRGYDVTHDGQRFVMLRIDDIESDSGSQRPTSVELILNWGEELKRRAPIAP